MNTSHSPSPKSRRSIKDKKTRTGTLNMGEGFSVKVP